MKGRNTKEEVRNTKIEIRVTEKEKKYFHKKAKMANMNLSEYMRDLITNTNLISDENSTNTTPSPRQIPDVAALVRLGNNLNQLTRYSHQNKQLHCDLIELVDKIKKTILST